MLVSSKQKASPHHMREVRSNPTERYTLREKIGQGGFGFVYKAVDNITGELVAAKLINLDEAGDELEDVQQEVTIMSSSTCTQLTKYYASYLSGRYDATNSHIHQCNIFTFRCSQLWIVMEYLEAGSLADILLDEGPLDVESVAYVMRELLMVGVYEFMLQLMLDFSFSPRLLHTFMASERFTETSRQETSFSPPRAT